VISILQSFLLPNLLDDIPQLDYFNYLTYFVCPLQPFICVFSLPELIKILKAYWKKIGFLLDISRPFAMRDYQKDKL
ncbi:unnamed protein product, partial [Adineta steineri]